MRLTPPLAPRLDDAAADQVARNHAECIKELQRLPAASELVLPDVRLEDGVTAILAHGLGRAPRFVAIGVPRGATSAGVVVETREGLNRTRYLALTASGYGETITVDVSVR